jgi:hypothetical protein
MEIRHILTADRYPWARFDRLTKSGQSAEISSCRDKASISPGSGSRQPFSPFGGLSADRYPQRDELSTGM